MGKRERNFEIHIKWCIEIYIIQETAPDTEKKLISRELEYDLASVKTAYFTLSFRPIFPNKPKAATHCSMYENTFPPNSQKNYSYSDSNVDILSYQDPRLLANSYMMYKIGKFLYLVNSKYFQ